MYMNINMNINMDMNMYMPSFRKFQFETLCGSTYIYGVIVPIGKLTSKGRRVVHTTLSSCLKSWYVTVFAKTNHSI